jgi:hypothetical protein
MVWTARCRVVCCFSSRSIRNVPRKGRPCYRPSLSDLLIESPNQRIPPQMWQLYYRPTFRKYAGDGMGNTGLKRVLRMEISGWRTPLLSCLLGTPACTGPPLVFNCSRRGRA